MKLHLQNHLEKNKSSIGTDLAIRTILGQLSIVRNSVLLNTTGFDSVKHIIRKNASAMFYRVSTSQISIQSSKEHRSSQNFHRLSRDTDTQKYILL